MIFSKACEYGIRATIHIAQQSLLHKRSSLKDISREIDSPEAFTSKILQQLVKSEIIKSVQGATGGFEIDEKKLKSIKLVEIVKAIDGELDEDKCVLGLKQCSETHPCPVHHKYKHIKKDLLAMLYNTSLKDMSNGVKNGLNFLKI